MIEATPKIAEDTPRTKDDFNQSRWALEHLALTRYLIHNDTTIEEFRTRRLLSAPWW